MPSRRRMPGHILAGLAPVRRRRQSTRVNDWDRRGSSDRRSGGGTAFDRLPDARDDVERFYESGRAVAAALLDEIGPLFRGRSLAIEIGCGVGQVLLGHAQHFERLRGVDTAPDKLALLEQRAAHMGIDNVQGFLPTQPWDEPTGAADYVYSLHVFQYIDDRIAIADYIQGISRALRRGGIAHLQFDTRPRHLLYRTRQHVPDRLLGPSQRRGIRSIRRKEDWVRDRIRGADMQVIGERQFGTADHWFVARRR